MAIVWDCPLSVDAYAALGRAVDVPRPSCPSCEAEMIFWSGYLRPVRYESMERDIWIRRACCHHHGSHALLPSFLLVKRLYAVEVVGEIVATVADGTGTRRAAKRVGVPHTTARSWWRRHRERAVLAAVLMVALGCAAGGAATIVVLRALGAPGMTIGQGSSRARWWSVSLRCGGAWLAPLTTTTSPLLEVSPEAFHCSDGT